MGVFRQMACTGIICYLTMSFGIMFTWPSSTLVLFQSENTTLSRRLTSTELALFGSLASIGALISTPLASVILNRLGRKYATVVSALMHVIAWTLIVTLNQVEVMLTAVFISGLGGSLFLIAPVYISEFCQTSIRGSMTAAFMTFYSIGMLISYLFGGLLDYKTMNYSCLTISVIGVLMLGLLKESPVYLLQRGLEEEAAKSIAFYRSEKVNSKEVVEEILAIKRTLNPDNDDYVQEEQLQLNKQLKPKEKLSAFEFIKKSRSTRRAAFICLVLVMATIFQGLVVVQVYAGPLFKEAVPNMSPTLCSVIFSLVTILSGFLAAYLCEIAGRKPLLVYGSIGSGICCVVLGSQIQFHWAPHAFTAVCMYLFCVVYTVGAGTVPFVLSVELFLPEIKTLMSMLMYEVLFLGFFIILFIFNPLVEALGLGPVFYIFAFFSFATAIYCVFSLPETKGLSIEVIQTLLTKRKGRGEC